MRRAAVFFLLALLGLGAIAFAQSPEPRLRLTPRPTSGPAAQAPSSSQPVLPIAQVIGALAIVIGLILLLRWGGRKVLPGTGGGGVIKVISRTTIAPRQQLLLLQVGQRLVLAGQCGGQMSRLCEITDPQEVAQLLGQAQSEKSGSLSSAFSSFFSRAEQGYVQPAPPAAPASAATAGAGGPAGAVEEPLAKQAEELRGLLDKVRSMTSQYK